jgi:quercetin dioxygenase-like cupin family protein
MVGLTVEFPLYQLGHLYETRRDRRGAEFVADKEKPQNQKERKKPMNALTQFKIRTLPLLIAPVLIALGAFTAAPALATPNCGVITDNLLYPGQPVDTAHAAHFPSGSLNLMCRSNLPAWLLNTRIRGDSDLYITKHTFPVGAHTGWHTHPGPSLITVVAGELTVYESDSPNCAPIVYHAGESFTDVGCGDIHLVRNEGTVPAMDVAVQIVPAGAARRIDADQPASCPVITCP